MSDGEAKKKTRRTKKRTPLDPKNDLKALKSRGKVFGTFMDPRGNALSESSYGHCHHPNNSRRTIRCALLSGVEVKIEVALDATVGQFLDKLKEPLRVDDACLSVCLSLELVRQK